MKISSAPYTALRRNTRERTVACFAAMARRDTLYGGMSALIKARRFDRLYKTNMEKDVVSKVYARSSGRWHEELEAWYCPECHTATLGKFYAEKCCEPENDENYGPRYIPASQLFHWSD